MRPLGPKTGSDWDDRERGADIFDRSLRVAGGGRSWRAVTVALADGEAVELAAPVALGPRDRARLAATKQTAKDTAGTTAVGRHPPKFREPSNKRILTRAKCNYAKPGEEIELIFEDGGFNATKSQRTASGALRELEAENKFLDLLRKTRTKGRYVNEA